jgi:hypothetical protein
MHPRECQDTKNPQEARVSSSLRVNHLDGVGRILQKKTKAQEEKLGEIFLLWSRAFSSF